MKADGILGLSPRMIPDQGEEKNTENVIWKWYENGSIKKPIFSLHFDYVREKSTMVIGGYDQIKIKNKGNIRAPTDDPNDMTKTDDGIFWMNINSDFYWMVDLYEAWIGEDKIHLGEGDTGNIYINSGTSVNFIPENAYESIINMIVKNHKCKLSDYGASRGMYKCEACTGPADKSYPQIKLRMGSIFN